MKAQTTIVIAHRLGTIRNADKICLINGGKIAEMGTHDELFNLNGLYADLVRLQMSGNEDSPESPTKQIGITSEEEEGKGPVTIGTLQEVEKEVEKKKKAIVEVKPTTLSQEEKKNVTSKIWGLVKQHPLWMITGCLGAAVFGAVFPGNQ